MARTARRAPVAPGVRAIAPVRSFVAVLLPPAVRGALASEIERLSRRARVVGWVAADNLHLTLKFLGWVEPPRLDAVTTSLEEVAAASLAFNLTVEGLGAFPSPTRARVIWAGISGGTGPLVELATRVEYALAGLGFAAEDRPFSGHVTLGRVRDPRRNDVLAEALAAGGGRQFGGFRVDEIALMRSDLSPKGARYTPLRSWPLTGS